VHGGGVDPVELGPVAEHHADRVATLQAEPRETGGQLLDLVVVVRPGHRQLVALGADGDAVRELADGHLEGAADRRLLECLYLEVLTRAGLSSGHVNSLPL
jgi:hypothetical protein